MTLKLITAPASEPVTLAEAKLHLRCGDDEDALLNGLITTARQQAEHQLGRALITQTWERVLHHWPSGHVPVRLGVPPVTGVVSVIYIDSAGATITMPPEHYILDADSTPPAIEPAPGRNWPLTLDVPNAVRIRFTAGYVNAATVPAAIKSWMLLRIGTLYKLREEIVSGKSVSEIPGGYTDRLLDPYRIWGA